MATAGNSGTTKRNMSRGVLRNIGVSEVQPYVSEIRFWDVDKNEPFEDDCYFLLPYEVLDDEIEQSGGDVSKWCELPPNSPLQETKNNWLKT